MTKYFFAKYKNNFFFARSDTRAGEVHQRMHVRIYVRTFMYPPLLGSRELRDAFTSPDERGQKARVNHHHRNIGGPPSPKFHSPPTLYCVSSVPSYTLNGSSPRDLLLARKGANTFSRVFASRLFLKKN